MLLFLHFLNFTLRRCNPFTIKERKKLLYNKRTQFCYSPKSTLLAISSPTLQPANSYYIMCQTIAPFFKHTGMEQRKTEAWQAGCYYRDRQGPGYKLWPAFQHRILQPLQGNMYQICLYVCIHVHAGTAYRGHSSRDFFTTVQSPAPSQNHRSQIQLRSGRTGQAHLTQLFNGHYQPMLGVSFPTYTNKSCGCLQSSQTGPGMQ